MRNLIILTFAAALLSACMHEPIHQGNRLKPNSVNLISVGETKFTIEQRLGSPSLQSTLHPRRIVYYEMFEDDDSGDMRKRGVEITYDDAWRASEIHRFGFDGEHENPAPE